MGVLLRHRTLKDGRKSYYLDINHNGKRYREFINVLIKKANSNSNNDPKVLLSYAEAIRNKRERELIIEKNDIADVIKTKTSFTDFFSGYKNSYTGKDYRKIEAAFKHFETYFGKDVFAGSLKYDHCNDFYKYLREKLNGETPATYFGVFRKVLNVAVRKGIIRHNPANGIRVKRTTALVKQVLTTDEIQKLYNNHCGNEQVKRAFLLSCNTGLGLSEIKKLQWKHINDNKLSHLNRSKTNTALVIELNHNAQMLLGERGRQNDFIFDLPSSNACNKDIKNWVKRAKIDKHITYYSARHSFACNLLLNGANPKTVSNLLGHQSLQFTEKYLNHVDKLNKDAVDAIPQFKIEPILKVIKDAG